MSYKVTNGNVDCGSWVHDTVRQRYQSTEPCPEKSGDFIDRVPSPVAITGAHYCC